MELIRNGQGIFHGSLLLGDISGFTALTELLAKAGKDGTEELTILLNDYFDRMLTIVEKYHGSVITFSGDSLLVRFNMEEDALKCAGQMLEAMDYFRDMTLLGNVFTLKAKVVVVDGQWNQYIIGDSQRAHILLSGGLIRELALRESKASADALIHFKSSMKASSVPVPPPLVKNEAFVSPGSKRIFGEHRSVTAVFLTVHTEESGHRVIENFQKLYIDIARTVRRFGGYLHHIDDMLPRGSRILILFGAPVSHGNDTLNSLLAVTDIFEGERDRYGFMISCGIDAGYAFSGIVGNEKRKQYTVIGDSVNTAARLAENTAVGTVYVSENVYNRVHTHFSFTELPGIHVKGKNKPLKRFMPAGRLETAYNPVPFVGREKELKTVVDLLKESNQTILVSGNAGIGKSCFLDKLSEILSATGFIVARAGRTRHGPVNEILISLVENICGISSNKDKAAILKTLHSYLSRSAIPELVKREIFLARMLFSIDVADKTFDAMTPKLRLENLVEAIALLVGSLKRPACVIVEDIHYSDLEEIESLQEVIHATSVNPASQLSFIFSTRPDDRNFFKDRKTVFQCVIHGMEPQQSVELLAGVAEKNSIAGEILTVLTERAKGNPFFLVQFFYYLKEKRLILLRNGTWEKNGNSSLEELPESIFSMIMARIDALTDSTRQSIKVASVAGFKFDENIISMILERSVRIQLIEASEAELISSVRQSVMEHVFNHMLIRDVAYDSMLRERRRLVHRDIGLILEKGYSTEKNLSRTLAYHFINAEEWKKAVKYSMDAGRLAAEEYRNREALEHYSNGIAIIEKHTPDVTTSLAECYFLKGSIKELTGDYPDAMTCYTRTEDLSTDLSLTGNAVLGMAELLYTQGKLEEALKKVDDLNVKLVAAHNSDTTFDLKIAAFRAWTYCVEGKIDQAMKNALIAVEIGESLEGLPELVKAKKLGHALNTLATVHWVKGEYSSAGKLYERAIEIALENGMKREAALTYGNIGLVLEKQGKYREAVQGMEKQLKISREVGDKLLILSAQGELCTVHAQMGNYKEALSFSHRQIKLAESINAVHDIILGYNHRAAIHSSMGDQEAAFTFAGKALELSRSSSYEREEAYALSVLGEIKTKEGDLESAMKLLTKAGQLAENVHSYPLLQEIYLKTARIMISEENYDKSKEILSEVCDILKKTEMKTDSAVYHCILGELLAAKGSMEEAFQNFETGASVLRDLEARPSLARAYKSFGRLLKKLNCGNITRSPEYMKKAADLYLEMELPEEAVKCTDE